jgi:hypothetical protein
MSNYTKDYGQGKPVILIHIIEWNVEYQIDALVQNNLESLRMTVVVLGNHHNLGWYDYDTLTDDLKAIIEHLT